MVLELCNAIHQGDCPDLGSLCSFALIITNLIHVNSRHSKRRNTLFDLYGYQQTGYFEYDLSSHIVMNYIKQDIDS